MSKLTIPADVTMAQLLTQRQTDLRLTDQQIAHALRYDEPTVIKLIKQGKMRLPINRVPELALALEVDPGELMRVHLREIDPAMLSAIESCMGPLALSPGETRLLMALRKSAGGRETGPILLDGAQVVAIVVGT